ncbi:MAG: transposase [Chloroflexota bacterium]|nr:transposase [Chloroflexota bacterium]
MDRIVAAEHALRRFRDDFYRCLERRADALFERTDAILAAGPQPSFAYLRLAAPHRRGWGRLYAALREGRIDTDRRRALLGRHAPDADQPEYAVECSVWPRGEAETSAERGYYYHPSHHLDGQPIVKGWSYQWIVQLGFARDSWTAPADVQRVQPWHGATEVAVEQVRALVRRRGAASAAPVFVFDAGYDVTALTHARLDEPVNLLVRLRRDRCFYGPPPVVRARTGRPRRNGAKFRCDDPATWPAPTAEHACEDAQYGTVTVQAWAGLHPVVRSPLGERTYERRPHVTGIVIRVTVTRHAGRARTPLELWLWWQGPDAPNRDRVWRSYFRRYDIAQTFRFLKQALNWATPQIRTPAQADRWTWLVAVAYSQLRLARAALPDQRRPWQRAQSAGAFTPVRAQRGFSTLLLALGTPADAPKPCGRSPGRPNWTPPDSPAAHPRSSARAATSGGIPAPRPPRGAEGVESGDRPLLLYSLRWLVAACNHDPQTQRGHHRRYCTRPGWGGGHTEHA